MVSVIIPTYNRADRVTEAVESALNQTHGCLEIIVVDDGSTDATRAMLASCFPQIKYLYQRNTGPAGARNRGIRESEGEYIAFLDSDDLWKPDKVRRQVTEFLRDEQLSIVSTNVLFRYPDREVRSNIMSLESDALREHFLDGFLMVTSSVMIKRQCIESAGLFDESFCYAEDMDFFYRIVRKYKGRILPDALTINRREPNRNLMTDTSRRERLVADTVRCIDTIYSYPENALDNKRNKRRKDRYRTFFRWIGLTDLYANPRFAGKCLYRALRFRPWDAALYVPFVKSFLIGGRMYPYLKAVKAFLGSGKIKKDQN